MFDGLLRDNAEDYARAADLTVEETLLDRFNRHFRTVPADTPDLIRRAQEIRYQVYCVERQFENPADHPDHREKDKFDAHSVHSLLVQQATGHAVGTVRLVLPRRDAPAASFAIQRVVERTVLAPLPIATTAEVSRFSISKQFRDLTAETLSGAERVGPSTALKWTSPLMSLGLIQTLVAMSARHGITHWCALMEPKLLRMLAAMAIHFKPLGPLVEHHGIRQPCYCHVATILDRVKHDRPMFWQILTDGGRIDTWTMAA